jgi:hypothetical protein
MSYPHLRPHPHPPPKPPSNHCRAGTPCTGDCGTGGEGFALEFGALSPTAVSAALALLIASENGIGGGVVVVVVFAVLVGVVDATRPARPARPCRGGKSSFGNPFLGLPKLLLSATYLVELVLYSIPSSGYIPPEAMATGLSVLFEKIAFRQRARGSKFSRRPDRSCPVGEVKVVSHGCARACSAVRRQGGSGFRRARMKSFAVCTVAVVRNVVLECSYDHTFV